MIEILTTIKDELTDLKPIKRSTLADSIIDKLGDLITRGVLKPGDNLPSERKLSEMLEVSRLSVRQSIKALEISGLVETKTGSGSRLSKSWAKVFIKPTKFMSILLNTETSVVRHK